MKNIIRGFCVLTVLAMSIQAGAMQNRKVWTSPWHLGPVTNFKGVKTNEYFNRIREIVNQLNSNNNLTDAQFEDLCVEGALKIDGYWYSFPTIAMQMGYLETAFTQRFTPRLCTNFQTWLKNLGANNAYRVIPRPAQTRGLPVAPVVRTSDTVVPVPIPVPQNTDNKPEEEPLLRRVGNQARQYGPWVAATAATLAAIGTYLYNNSMPSIDAVIPGPIAPENPQAPDIIVEADVVDPVIDPVVVGPQIVVDNGHDNGNIVIAMPEQPVPVEIPQVDQPVEMPIRVVNNDRHRPLEDESEGENEDPLVVADINNELPVELPVPVVVAVPQIVPVAVVQSNDDLLALLNALRHYRAGIAGSFNTMQPILLNASPCRDCHEKNHAHSSAEQVRSAVTQFNASYYQEQYDNLSRRVTAVTDIMNRFARGEFQDQADLVAQIKAEVIALLSLLTSQSDNVLQNLVNCARSEGIYSELQRHEIFQNIDAMSKKIKVLNVLLKKTHLLDAKKQREFAKSLNQQTMLIRA